MNISSDITALNNERLLNLLSMYLNDAPRAIAAEDIAALREFDVSSEEAFALTLAGLFSLDVADNEIDRAFFDAYFPHMIHVQHAADFADDPYLKTIEFPEHAIVGNASFAWETFAPYEGFVCDDFTTMPDGRIIPHIGFFEEEYRYPTAMENGRIWMSVTPQEINTVRPAVEAARGKVLTFGLGLGYFAFMAARKSEVESVTVVDLNSDIIEVFTNEILPQFGEFAGKVSVVHDDAFEFARRELPGGGFDMIYGDIWHDVGDGLDLYLAMKELEPLAPEARWEYWIEPTMRCYL
ncbi:MAG: hypothetical protein ACOYIP_03135 [Coriobacteriales bacterium]|jgi:hypothetical protein